MACGCKKRQHPIIQQQPAPAPATIRLTETQPEQKTVSEAEQKIIQQIAEELQKLHAQNQ